MEFPWTGWITHKNIIINTNYQNYYNRYNPPYGFYFWSLDRVSSFNIDIDRNIRTDDNGSFKIELEKQRGIVGSSIVAFQNQPLRLNRDIFLINRDYYPKPGDILNTKFLLRVDELINFQVSFNSYIVTTSGQWINVFSTTVLNSPNNNFQIYSFFFPLPTNININDIDFIRYEWVLHFNSTTDYAKAKLYLDDFEVYAYRNNECLILPQQRSTPLNFFDIHWKRDKDFIEKYINKVKIQTGFDMNFLRLRGLDQSFSHIPYISLTTLHRYFKIYISGLGRYHPPKNVGEWSFYFDEHTVPSTTPPQNDVHGSTTYYRFHPQARYPEYFYLSDRFENRYLKIQYTTNYGIILVNLNNPKLSDSYSKIMFNKIKTVYNDSPIGPIKYMFLDNISSPYESNRPGLSERYKNQFKIISPYKIIGNLGYVPSGVSKNLKQFAKGYMDEGWLVYPDANNFSFWPTSTFFRTVRGLYLNHDLDYIFLVIGYPPNQATCTNDYNDQNVRNLVNKIISAMYAVNNPNIYFALLKGGSEKNSHVPHCYIDAMYLPLGRPIPEKITDINQIIYSTSTLDEGIVILRRYERGLAIFNSSHRSDFTYILSTSTEPFSFYKDALGNQYDFSTRNISITIPASSGIILYND